ncbi:MAG: hypothetical protein GTO18_11680 [Anaerolineales bacterium]|nr:hypothetical protein [Anaerolineales bacterium]
MSSAHSFYRLQEVDLALDRHHARLNEIKDILEDSEELLKAQRRKDEAEETLHEKQYAQKQAEHAVGSQENKIDHTEKSLYGGAITNPKELQDLQMEAESLRRYLSVLEDRLLDAMFELEQAESEFENARTALGVVEENRKAEHKELIQEQEKILNDIARLEGDHEAALASITPDDLELYETLREKYGGLVVSLLEGGNCSLCGLSLPASTRQQIKSGTKIIQCSQCNRVLYAG